MDLFNFEVISFPYLESNVPSQICYNTFFSQLVTFANICSNFAGFAERVKLVFNKLLFNKLLARKYDKELLKRTFHKFVCQYSDTVLGFTPNIQNLLQSCLEFQNCVPPGDIDHNTPNNIVDSTTQTLSYLPSRKPIGLCNSGNTCYLNSILQILFQLNQFGFYDRWINHVLSIDKTKCTDYNKLLAFDKFLHLFKVDTISHGQLSDFVSISYDIDQFFEVNVHRDVHEALLLLLEIFSGVNHIPVPSNNEITDNLLPDFMDFFFYGLYKVQFVCSSCQETNIYFEMFC